MKRRIFSVILTLVLVVSMCVVAGAPTALAGPVTNLTFSMSTNNANTITKITVGFKSTAAGALSGGDTINIKMPGFQYPGTIANNNVTINGENCQSVTIDGDTLKVAVPHFYGANWDFTIVIKEAAGVKTPQLSQEKNLVYDADGISGTADDNLHPAVGALIAYIKVRGDTAPDALYQIQVTTKKDTFPAVKGNIQIYDWLVMDITEFGQGDIVNVTGAGFTPGDVLTLNKFTNQPLIGSGIVSGDGTVNIQAVVAAKLPMIPFQGTDESGRASPILWPKCSLIGDAVWMISVAGVYPIGTADQFCTTEYLRGGGPEGDWQLIPSVDIPAPVLPGSQLGIYGRDWGDITGIDIDSPFADPTNPTLTDLDGDCYCEPALFNVPGLFQTDMYIGGDIVQPGTILKNCQQVAEPVKGPGCADDFMVSVPVPRNITPGAYEVTVSGGDQAAEIQVVGTGAIVAMGLNMPIVGEWPVSLNQLSCLVNPMLMSVPLIALSLPPGVDPTTFLGLGYNEICCDGYGQGAGCTLPQCQFNFPDCTGCDATIVTAFTVPTPSLTVTGTPCKGGMVGLQGSGFVPGEDFGIAVIQSGTPTDIATGITVDGQGNFVQNNVTIPVVLDPGTHTITVFFDPSDSTCDTCTGGIDAEGDEIAASAEVIVLDCGAIEMCNLVVDSTAGGSVANPGEGPFMYPCNTIIDLEAVADLCNEFVNWSGDTWTIADDNDPNAQITCDACSGTVTVTANFQHIEYNLNVTSGTGGTVIDPGEGDFVYDCGTVVPLEAQPDVGCSFTGWTGDAVGSPTQTVTQIVMDDDRNVVANFSCVTACGPALYDANTSCEIEFNEFVDALMDYLAKDIEFTCMVDVLMVYLTGSFC